MMKKIISYIILTSLFIYTLAYAAIKFERDHSGNYKAIYVSPTGEESLQAITEVEQDKVSINPYTEVEKNYTDVKFISIHARTGIDVRVAFGNYSTENAGNYDIIHAGTRLVLENLNIETLTVKLRGDDTATDTGVVSIIVGK